MRLERHGDRARSLSANPPALSILRFRSVLLICALTLATTRPRGADSFGIPETNDPELAWWRDSMKAHGERIGWWRGARFGMFVHWGVYSSLGNEYKGRRGGTYAEHIQRVLKIPIPEYRKAVAGIFNPTNFNADEWIRTAKEAGMGYFIITAKHHDGFAMWPTKVNDYNVMDATPWHHDPMADLRAACKKYGVRFGFYYSHAFDWGNENAPGNDWDYDHPGGDKLLGGRNWWLTRPEFLPKARRYVDEKAIPQLLELIQLYDPDIFWFDTPSKLPDSENFRIMKAVRLASPRVVINGRIVRGLGDYASTADRPAEFAPHEGDWEGIPTTNESYGWNKFDHSHKPASHFIQLIAKAAARGGNILMNFGPMGDGRMDPKDVEILHGIGDWWKVNGDSIRGTQRTPLAVQTWGESTRKGDTLFLHVFRWPKEGKLVVGGLKSRVRSVRLLGETEGTIAHKPRARVLNKLDTLIEGLPRSARNRADSVIELQMRGEISTDSRRLLQPGYGEERLHVFDATLSGKDLKFGAGKDRDAYVTGLNNPEQGVVWDTRLNEPAAFDVELTYDADSSGGNFGLTIGDFSLSGAVRKGTKQSAQLGRIHLNPGLYEIRLTARDNSAGELLRPRQVTLRAVEGG